MALSSRILVIDDEDLMREYVEETLVRAGYKVEVANGGEEGLARHAEAPFDIIVTDLKMTPVDGLSVVQSAHKADKTTQCIVMTAYGTIETAVEAMKAGAEDYILKPFTPDELELAIARLIEKSRLAEENRYLRSQVNAGFHFHAMIGKSKSMKAVYEQIEKVAKSKSTVFIRGESGTGKELVARAIHFLGNRKEQPFIKVNCAALSAGLLESELFGHEKGAFTGALERKIGRFELADQGSILLDEVSEIGAELQPKLLRALQEREIDRVGGNHSIPIDTRIVATSNRNLEEAVSEGKFREDLFFRLNVIPIQLPPLRERREDIPILTEHFVAYFCQENGRPDMKVDKTMLKAMKEYDWPGNVRELQNSIERAVVLTNGEVLGADDFVLAGPANQSSGNNDGLTAGMSIAQMEKELILKTLEKCGQNRTRAAEMLDISVRTLRNKLKEYREDTVLVGEEDDLD
jgi:DNA-binding NtrC family response regulator